MWMYTELWLKDGRRSCHQLPSSRSIVHICIHFPPSSHLVSASFQKPGGVGTVQLRHSCKDHEALSRDACDCCSSKTFLIFMIRYIPWIHKWSVHIEKLVANIIFFYWTVKISFRRKRQFYSFSFFPASPLIQYNLHTAALALSVSKTWGWCGGGECYKKSHRNLQTQVSVMKETTVNIFW